MLNLQHRRFRTAGLIGGIMVPAVMLAAFCFAQGEHKAETSGHKFKNITVLKDLPADQLIPTMHKFNDALGVKCDFCHIVNADHSGFDLDDKPAKKTARKMIIMVRDITKSQKVLGGNATCFMCHHGAPEPQMGATGGK